MKPLVVVGSINLDLVSRAPRIPRPGETLTGSTFETFPGGKGANQAFAARRLGAEVRMIGKVGRDAFAGPLRENLAAAGVDTSAVEEAQISSGIAQILTAPDGENVIVVVPGANSTLLPEDLDRHIGAIRGAEMLLAQLEIPMETVEHLAALARREGVPLVLDPAPARLLSPALLTAVSWLTPNESEAATLLGAQGDLPEEALRGAAESLLALGSGNVVLKLGPRGCYLALGDGGRFRVPGYAVQAVDATAAGDAFNAAFAVALARGRAPAAAAGWANAVAAISVTRPGAQPSMPGLAEVERFLAERPGPGPAD